MLLQSLVDTIEQLKTRLEVHGADLRTNEIRTRMGLIDPMLAVLGWNPADPSLVVPEYSIRGSHDRADYALLRPDGNPAAILEAKRLGEPFERHRPQMINYANMAGIAYAGLTDGNLWQLYSVFEQKPIDDRCILTVSISSDSTFEIALHMLSLWRANLESRRLAKAGDPIVINQPQEGNSSVEETIATLQENRLSVSEGSFPPFHWVAISDYIAIPRAKPLAMKMPDGTEYTVTHWYKIISLLVKWLWEKGFLSANNVPVFSSKTKYIVNKEPIHPTGKRFVISGRIDGAPLYIGTSRNIHSSTQAVRKLLNHCNQKPSEFYIATKQSS